MDPTLVREHKPWTFYNSPLSKIGRNNKNWKPYADLEFNGKQKRYNLKPLSVLCVDLLNFDTVFHSPNLKGHQACPTSVPLKRHMVISTAKREMIERLEKRNSIAKERKRRLDKIKATTRQRLKSNQRSRKVPWSRKRLEDKLKLPKPHAPAKPFQKILAEIELAKQGTVRKIPLAQRIPKKPEYVRPSPLIQAPRVEAEVTKLPIHMEAHTVQKLVCWFRNLDRDPPEDVTYIDCNVGSGAGSPPPSSYGSHPLPSPSRTGCVTGAGLPGPEVTGRNDGSSGRLHPMHHEGPMPTGANIVDAPHAPVANHKLQSKGVYSATQ